MMSVEKSFYSYNETSTLKTAVPLEKMHKVFEIGVNIWFAGENVSRKRHIISQPTAKLLHCQLH